MVTARVPDHEDSPAFPMLIAVAASLEERVRLAELGADVPPLLLVSSLEELRKLITPVPPSPEQPDPPEPEAQVAPRSVPERVPRPADVLTIDSARSVAQWRDQEVPLTDLEHDLLLQLTIEP